MDGTFVRRDRMELSATRTDSSLRETACRVLGAIIFYSLLTIVVLAAVPFGTVTAWWKSIFDVAVFALGILWTIESALEKKGIGWMQSPPRALFALVLFIVFQSLRLWRVPASGAGGDEWRALSSDPFETRLFIFHLLSLVVILGLLLRHTSTRHRLSILIYTVVGVGLGSAVFGLAREQMQSSSGFSIPYLPPGRGYGQFINANHFALLMEMTLGFITGFIVAGGARRLQTVVYVMMGLVLWLALILSKSRGGILGMLSLLLFLTLMYSYLPRVAKSRKPYGKRIEDLKRASAPFIARVLLAGCLIVVVGQSIAWIGGESLVSRLGDGTSDFSEEGTQNGANSSRRDIWNATWQLIESHPIAGVGFGGYWVPITRYHSGSGAMTPQQAHNDYLELLASGGLIGTAIALWLIALFIKAARVGLLCPDPFLRAASFGALAGVFTVAVHSVVDFGLHITINNVIFTILIAISLLKRYGNNRFQELQEHSCSIQAGVYPSMADLQQMQGCGPP